MHRNGFRRALEVAAALTAVLVLADCASDDEPPPVPEVTSITDSPPVTVGVVNDLPGFSSGDPTSPAGLDINVTNYVGSGLQTPVALTPIKTKDRDVSLLTNRADLIVAAYSITRSRNLKGVDFAGPYMVSPQALLVRAGPSPVTEKDVAAARKCLTVGTTANEVGLPGPETSTQKDSIGQCVTLLGKHLVDAVFDDTLVLYGYTQKFPGRFRVVLDGTYGTNQYYGIGIRGGRHADCVRINGILQKYLAEQWRADFKATLPDAVDNLMDTDGGKLDFESVYKPSANDMTNKSCLVNQAPGAGG